MQVATGHDHKPLYAAHNLRRRLCPIDLCVGTRKFGSPCSLAAILRQWLDLLLFDQGQRVGNQLGS